MTTFSLRQSLRGLWERTEPAMKKKTWILIAAVVGIVVIVIVNIRMSYEHSTDIEAALAKRGEIVEKVSGPGIVYAESDVQISSSVMGRITDLAVQEGDYVRAGDVLLGIDDSQYRARLRQAQAGHKAALARLELAATRVRDAVSEYKRTVALRERNLVSEKDLELAKSSADVADAEVNAARESALEAEAMLEAAEDDLAKTLIEAPLSGTVTSLNAEQGEIVITGTMNNPGTVIMTISNLDTMEVRAEIDETDIAKVRMGQKAEISVDAFADTVLAGTVSVVGSSSSTARDASYRLGERSTFEVRIRIDDYLPGLRPGMTTTVDIVTATEDSAVYVPLQALVLREVGEGDEKTEREGVFVIRDGRSRFTPIRTGISDDRSIAVVDDLGEEVRVVVGPFKTLRDLEDSTKVKVTKEKE
jgi:HlyD family secretion protein